MLMASYSGSHLVSIHFHTVNSIPNATSKSLIANCMDANGILNKNGLDKIESLS